jgi:hypothetical protein
MSARPTAAELVEATREFLEAEVLPVLDDPRLRFRALVAVNALGIAQRELEHVAADELSDDDLAELARSIRRGEVPAGTLGRLKEHVAARLRIASPRYLDRYR